MRLESRDLTVGLTLVGGVALALLAWLWLANPGREYFPLFVEYDLVEGLNQETPVRLHGFPVGRVQEIQPRMTEAGAVVFRVELRLRSDVMGDSALYIPQGTLARVAHPPVVGSPFIVLEPPPGGGEALPPGATVPGVRTDPFLEQVQLLTGQVSFSVTEVLGRATALMDTVEKAVLGMDRTLTELERRVPGILDEIEGTVAESRRVIGEAEGLLARTTPSVGSTLDSASVVLGEARRILARVDTLVTTTEPRTTTILANLDTLTWVLSHFAGQVSERPLRIITGVQPPPPRDSARDDGGSKPPKGGGGAAPSERHR